MLLSKIKIKSSKRYVKLTNIKISFNYLILRNGDADCKVVSVQKPDNTNDVVAQLSKSITITTRQENPKKNDTAAVTNMLANRGITVSSVSC